MCGVYQPPLHFDHPREWFGSLSKESSGGDFYIVASTGSVIDPFGRWGIA